MNISGKFANFCNKLKLGKKVTDIIEYRYESITKRLNTEYWHYGSYTSHSLYAGSYGRGTDIKGKEIDMLFELPDEVYERINNYSGNIQSKLLEEIKTVLENKFNSYIRADGQVIRIDFTDGICFELVPCFENPGRGYTYPDTISGGSWKTTNPKPEITKITSADKKWNNNLIRLCRMAKAWKDKWEVPIGDLLIDTLAYHFMRSRNYKDKSYNYYDLMTRDFFEFLKNCDEDQKYWLSPGAKKSVWRKGKFEPKAEQAYNIALDALNYENTNQEASANKRWRDIYGIRFPG